MKLLDKLKEEQEQISSFILELEEALNACKSYRTNASAVSFALMRNSYTKLFVTQDHPLASKHLPRLSTLGARAGCRSCANALLSTIETHLDVHSL